MELFVHQSDTLGTEHVVVCNQMHELNKHKVEKYYTSERETTNNSDSNMFQNISHLY